jgi:hypothetical protein
MLNILKRRLDPKATVLRVTLRRLSRRKLRYEIIGGLGHRQGAVDVERIYRRKDGDLPRRRKSDIRKNTLKAPGLLQDERAVTLGRHRDPGEPHCVHMPGFIHSEHRAESVAPEIRCVIDESLGGALVESRSRCH